MLTRHISVKRFLDPANYSHDFQGRCVINLSIWSAYMHSVILIPSLYHLHIVQLFLHPLMRNFIVNASSTVHYIFKKTISCKHFFN